VLKPIVEAQVKDEKKIEQRRNQLIQGAVRLITEKGFHRTTTREIADAAGFSNGTLYEYIRTKEDVLYLVCDRIYDEVADRLASSMDTHQGTYENLADSIQIYFTIIDEMQDEVLVMYQEAKSLSKDSLAYVLKKELEMVGWFHTILQRVVDVQTISISSKQVELMAHNLFVQGQMWAFRRWTLRSQLTLREYIDFQTENMITALKSFPKEG
jgi:AcrR family transcriptional regulator